MANDFTTSDFTEEDWPLFDSFAKEHFGQSHVRELNFNQHWFGQKTVGKWLVRKVSSGDHQNLEGLMMMIQVPAILNQQRISLSWISNTAITDEAIKSGIGAQLYFWAYKTFPAVGGLAGNENSNPINDKLGISNKEIYIDRYLLPLNASCKSIVKPGSEQQLKQHMRPPSFIQPDDINLQVLNNLPSDYSKLWSRVSQRFYFCTDRNEEYMKWRFLDAPYSQYSFVEMRIKNDLVALIPVRFQETEKGKVIRILDFIVEEEHDDKVMKCFLSYFTNKEYLFCDFFVIGCIFKKIFLDHGFLSETEQPFAKNIPSLLSPIEYRSWSNTVHFGGKLLKKDTHWRDPNKIYFSKSDSDRDWPTNNDLRGIEKMYNNS